MENFLKMWLSESLNWKSKFPSAVIYAKKLKYESWNPWIRWKAKIPVMRQKQAEKFEKSMSSLSVKQTKHFLGNTIKTLVCTDFSYLVAWLSVLHNMFFPVYNGDSNSFFTCELYAFKLQGSISMIKQILLKSIAFIP